jgi:hypothetical protein
MLRDTKVKEKGMVHAFIVEVPILINTSSSIYTMLEFQSSWDRTSIRLGSNFDHGLTNSVMTYALVLSAKVRRNEHLCEILDINNMFRPTFGYKKFHKIK